MTIDINLIREAVTVLSFLAFVGIVLFAVDPRNRARFDEAARLPVDEDFPLANPLPGEREQTLVAVSRNWSTQG